MVGDNVRVGAPLLVLLAITGAVVMTSGFAAAASPKEERSASAPVPGFDLLRKPTTLAALSRLERVQIRKALGDRAVRGLHTGEVMFAAGKVRAVGNGAVVCLFNGIESFGAGACVPRQAALRRGINILSFCGGASRDRARITGIVPNRVAGVRLQSTADGSVLGRVSVVSNVFTMKATPVEATLAWVGTASGISIPLPLARLASESECSSRSDGA